MMMEKDIDGYLIFNAKWEAHFGKQAQRNQDLIKPRSLVGDDDDQSPPR